MTTSRVWSSVWYLALQVHYWVLSLRKSLWLAKWQLASNDTSFLYQKSGILVISHFWRMCCLSLLLIFWPCLAFLMLGQGYLFYLWFLFYFFTGFLARTQSDLRFFLNSTRCHCLKTTTSIYQCSHATTVYLLQQFS